jgi:hypothetical protein
MTLAFLAGAYDIVANTNLDSDVPLPYFNWVEYDFRRAAQPKVRILCFSDVGLILLTPRH